MLWLNWSNIRNSYAILLPEGTSTVYNTNLKLLPSNETILLLMTQLISQFQLNYLETFGDKLAVALL